MILHKKAFTLIELVVGIAIIAIISIGVTKLYSSNIPDKQKLDLFTNKVIGILDSVKNYSLVGKGIGTNLDTPKYYKIELSKSGAYLRTFYNTGTLEVIYSPMSIDPFTQYYNIDSIECKNLDLSNISMNNNVSIIYEGSNVSLSGCTDNFQKVIDIELAYKGFKKNIRINSISGVLEEIKK